MADDPSSIGKRIRLDRDTWQAVDLLAKDSMKDFQELADEAFADLLRKHRRPVGFKAALRQSLREQPANDQAPDETARPAEHRQGVRRKARPAAPRKKRH